MCKKVITALLLLFYRSSSRPKGIFSLSIIILWKGHVLFFIFIKDYNHFRLIKELLRLIKELLLLQLFISVEILTL